MQAYSGVPIKHSISTKLLTVVFAIYLGVAVVVMLVHIWVEYVETRKQVVQELSVLQKAFERGIATSLWYLDIPLLESEMRGMLEHFVVVGVRIENDKGEGFTIGKTPEQPGRSSEMATPFRVSADQKAPESSTLIEHNFPLVHIAEDGERYEVGAASIYSSHTVILQRLQWKLLLILLASIVNMAAFWVIVLFVGQRLLSRPLAILTEGARQLNLENLEHFQVDIKTKGRDELKILEETFNAMIRKLLEARTILYEYANELHQSRQQLQDILDNTTAVIFIKDIEGRYLLVNRQYESLFHISKAEITGKTDYDVFPKEMADVFRCNDQQVVNADGPVEIEEHVPHDDGIHTYLSVKFPLRDTDGRMYAVCGIAADISARKRAEEQIRKLNQELEQRVQERTARLSETNALLKESEQRLKEAQRIAQLGNWEWNIRTNELFWSDEVYRIFSVQPQEFDATYEAFAQTVHPDDREVVQRAVNNAIYHGASYSLDHRIVLPDDTVRMVHEQGEVMFDKQHEPVQMLGTVQDMTERKKVEEALRASEHQLQLITDNTPAYIAYVGIDDLRYRFVNRSFEIAYARPREQIIGQHIKDIIGDANYQFALRYIDMVRAGQSASYENSFPTELGTRWIQVNYVPDFDEQGAVRAIVVMSHDITAVQQAKEAALEAQRASEAANRAKSTFLANMSHELRTPLHNILGFARRLEQDAALTEDQQQGVEIIERNGERLLTLVNDILDLTKIEANRFELHPSQFALRSLLDQLAGMYRREAGRKGLNFLYDAPADLPGFVYGDQKRLRQILQNLLDNAMRFTEQGSITLKIAYCRYQSSIFNFQFSITDTGIGIAAEHLENLFQPFQQADPQRLQEGRRGLGLAISQQCVHLMGSRIHVASTQGEGSKFWFELELPVIAAAVKDVTQPAPARSSEYPSQDALTTALAALPADWLAILRRASAEVDPEALSDIIVRIHERDPILADALTRLLEDFKYDGILRLTEEGV